MMWVWCRPPLISCGHMPIVLSADQRSVGAIEAGNPFQQMRRQRSSAALVQKPGRPVSVGAEFQQPQ